MQLVCVVCNAVQEATFSPVCGKCGSLTNPVYDLDRIKLSKSENPYLRYFDLLPVRDISLLPKDVGYSPVVHARSLGARIGMTRLYLKNETVLPTGTTKFRMASIALPYLYESGVTHFCASSTGNTSTAYATQISRIPELRMSLFTAEGFRYRVNFKDNPQVSHYILEDASFVEAFEAAGTCARMRGYTSERGFFNPGRREGLKLAFLEATDQVPGEIDCYVQAVSSAMGVYGTYSGARQLLGMSRISRIPRLICVQQASCAPMATAWDEGSATIRREHVVHSPSGIAEAILRGNPTKVYPYIRDVIQKSRGLITEVSEQAIRRARRLLYDEEGIEVCYSSATAVAGVMRLVAAGAIASDESVLINLTGRDRTGEPAADGVYFHKVAENHWQGPGCESIYLAESANPSHSEVPVA